MYKPIYTYIPIHIYICKYTYTLSFRKSSRSKHSKYNCLAASHRAVCTAIQWCHTYHGVNIFHNWVMARIQLSHGTYTIESWHAYHGVHICLNWVMACISLSHGTQIIESWHAHHWVMARTSLSHGTQIIESWHAYHCVKTCHVYCRTYCTMRRIKTAIREPWLNGMRDMTPPGAVCAAIYMRHDSFACEI